MARKSSHKDYSEGPEKTSPDSPIAAPKKALEGVEIAPHKHYSEGPETPITRCPERTVTTSSSNQGSQDAGPLCGHLGLGWPAAKAGPLGGHLERAAGDGPMRDHCVVASPSQWSKAGPLCGHLGRAAWYSRMRDHPVVTSAS